MAKRLSISVDELTAKLGLSFDDLSSVLGIPMDDLSTPLDTGAVAIVLNARRDKLTADIAAIDAALAALNDGSVA
jgi:hypothetical protein